MKNEIALATALDYVIGFCPDAVKIAYFADQRWLIVDDNHDKVVFPTELDTEHLMRLLDDAEPGTFCLPEE